MDEYIKKIMEDFLDIRIRSEYLFRSLYGLTLVFRREYAVINNQLSSATIEPIGIIYEENGEYYYAPLHDGDKIDDIVKEFVRNN